MKKSKLCSLLCALLAVCFLIAGCTPASSPEETPDAEATPVATEVPNVEQNPAPEVKEPEQTAAPEEPRTGEEKMDEIFGKAEERAQKYAPKVTTLDNGVRVQRTPNDAGAYWKNMGKPTSYNTYYLNADNRGCGACHTDLVALLANLEYDHLDLRTDRGYDMNVLDCRICHVYGEGYLWKATEFGSLIHGIHSKETFKGNCMTCHNATEDGQGMRLWDEAKYDVLQGISFLPDVQGEFRYDQNVLSDVFNANWSTGPSDYVRDGNEKLDLPLDPDIFDNWTIEVYGEVENPFTITLKELIEQAPSETHIMTSQCVMNPNGGPWIQNVEVKGIPLQWLLDKAVLKDTAVNFLSHDPQGWNRGLPLSHLEKYPVILAYELNGERLPWSQGYPLTTYTAGSTAFSFIRKVCKIEVAGERPMAYFDGWPAPEGTDVPAGVHVNKPSAGLYQFKEGQIIKAGEPYTFEGFAHGYDQQIIAVDFSLDRGKTWTRFDTSDSDLDKWVYWYFTYTPEKPGSYVLSIRSETAEGLITYRPDETLFHAE